MVGAGDQPQDPEHDSGQVSLEAAQRLAPALSLGLFPSEERSRRSMHASLGDSEPMQSAIELTVALAVQAMAKLLAADASWAAAEMCVQTHGGFGFAEEFDIERKFRETRLYQVAPISTNLILAYLAEHVLGLPRSY